MREIPAFQNDFEIEIRRAEKNDLGNLQVVPYHAFFEKHLNFETTLNFSRCSRTSSES